MPVGVALILAASATPVPVLLTVIVMACLVAAGVAEREHHDALSAETP